jgi:hypothetical protein
MCFFFFLWLYRGTLAKLVYFEQKAPDFDPLQTSLRERQYAQAASAHTILMARIEEEEAATARKVMSSTNRTMSNASSDSNMSAASASPKSRHQYFIRRRSFSVGVMGRLKERQKEQQKEMEQHQNEPKEHQSEQDLKRLYALRQDSMPDDIRQFRHSIGFQTLQEEQCRGLYEEGGSDHGEYASSGDGGGDSEDDVGNEMKVNMTTSVSSMGKSKSMFDLSAHFQQKAEALDRFYNFARRLDAQEESIRDHKLRFYSRELGGEFHFIRFETRRMKNAMDLIRYNNLHLNIVEMG